MPLYQPLKITREARDDPFSKQQFTVIKFIPLGERISTETPEQALSKANLRYPHFQNHLAVEPVLWSLP